MPTDSQQPGLNEINSLLDKGDAGAWQDAAGNSLLHHAARLGDKETVERCLALGLKASAYNKENECPRDVARSWGHDTVAQRLDAQMQQEKAATPAPAIGYTSLDKIRAEAAKTGDNLFYHFARRGVFDQIIALAEKDPDGLTAADLLGKGKDGDTTLLALCAQGQLPLLLKPELWAKNPADFILIWEKVPRIYQNGLDVKAFILHANQSKLRTQSPRAQWKGPL